MQCGLSPFGVLRLCLCLCLVWHTTPGKGCFLPDVLVTLVDGSTRPLQDIGPGESVLSWDEEARGPALSRVQATPAFQRSPSELVEVRLPHAHLITTDDHPFWSRMQGSLVSLEPNKTAHEYGLQASLFQAVEELEGPQAGGVAVAATWRSWQGQGTSQTKKHIVNSEGRRLRSGVAKVSANLKVNANVTMNVDANETVKVMTLCLEPYHWFFVHGVRVHNKGCFLKTAEVMMADGQRKQLQEIEPGDAVASFDENSGTASTSLVVAPQRFRRRLSELVELDLPHTTLRVTEDHPLWSRRQQSLVSAQPAHTMQEYQLTAKPLVQGEELEDVNLQGVEVRAVRPVSLRSHVNNRVDASHGLNVSARRLSVHGEAELAQTQTHTRTQEADLDIEVMTLCLHPHHWFFIHGVRVHNKGCFAPWVRVLLSNGSYLPLLDVRPSDKVVSWDEERDEAAEGTVLSVESFPVTEVDKMVEMVEMVEMELRAPASSPLPLAVAAPSSLPSGLKGKRLVLTPDHPIYSVRHGGVVSLNPSRTWENYGIAAGQMLESELLRHHAGHDVEAIVRPYREELPTAVMTLHLDRHHWFYAEGVRVHNKGGSSGGSSSSFASGVRYRYVDRNSFSNPYGYSNAIILTTRRRRGVWVNDTDGCDIAADHASLCFQQSLDMDTCERCNECTDATCVTSIPRCNDFLSSVYSQCVAQQDGSHDVLVCSCIAISAICLAFTCGHTRRHRSGDRGRGGGGDEESGDEEAPSAQEREAARKRLTGIAFNGHGIGQCSWIGQYFENGESKPTAYQWTADPGGRFNGSTKDDDGLAQVRGAFNWPADKAVGQIAWRETWQNGGNVVEAAGTIGTSNGLMAIQAEYSSTLGVKGIVQLQLQQPASWFKETLGQPVTGQPSETKPLLG